MEAYIGYTADTGETLVNETFGPNNIRRRNTGATDAHPVEISNGRNAELSMERNGFELVEHRTTVKNFFDPEELKSVYYPEVERLIKARSGAARAVVFDHTLRSGSEGERLGVPTASARTRPDLACGRTAGRLPKRISTCPAITAVPAGPLPLYGICSA